MTMVQCWPSAHVLDRKTLLPLFPLTSINEISHLLIASATNNKSLTAEAYTHKGLFFSNIKRV